MNLHPFGDWRWWLASWLCYFACRLRRQRWYVADTWHGVPGNRAAELRQQIWMEAASQIACYRDESDYHEYMDSLRPRLGELAQLASEAWGHYPEAKARLVIWPP